MYVYFSRSGRGYEALSAGEFLQVIAYFQYSRTALYWKMVEALQVCAGLLTYALV